MKKQAEIGKGWKERENRDREMKLRKWIVSRQIPRFDPDLTLPEP